MGYNKFITKDNKVLLDLTSDTVAADKMVKGVTSHDKYGNLVTGTIESKTSNDLTVSGATVNVPAGHYSTAASASLPIGSATTPATTITKNPTISVSSAGKITASVSGTQSVTPSVTAGYVSSGTAGTITVSGSATKTLTTQAAQTITPGTSNKTIASGRYLTGTQTIKGDSNLVASNIKSGVSIFGVTGTYAGTTENLDAVITELETKTSELNTILANKAAGSGGDVTLDTCTLEILSMRMVYAIEVICTVVEEGRIYGRVYSGSPQICINNVLCGSAVFMIATGFDGVPSGLTCNGAEMLPVDHASIDNAGFLLTAEPGETAIITYEGGAVEPV